SPSCRWSTGADSPIRGKARARTLPRALRRRGAPGAGTTTGQTAESRFGTSGPGSRAANPGRQASSQLLQGVGLQAQWLLDICVYTRNMSAYTHIVKRQEIPMPPDADKAPL